VPHPQQSKGSRKAGLQEWHNIGTSCLTGNQKVSEWIATHLQQIDGLQIRHFVPHPAIKRLAIKKENIWAD